MQPHEDMNQVVALDPARRHNRQRDEGKQHPLEHLGLGLAKRSRLIFDDQAGHAAGDQQVSDMAIEPESIRIDQRGDPARQRRRLRT